MSKMNSMSMKAALIAAVFLMSACAPTRTLDVEPIAEAESPGNVVNSLNDEIATARKDRLNVLSPTWFSRAEASLEDAKKGLDSGHEISKILQNVAKGRAQLQTAEEMAKLARAALPDVIKSRDLARAAGATSLDDYAEAEGEFLELTRAIEDNNMRYAQRNREKVSEAFQRLELRAIKVQTIGEVHKVIAEAEGEGANKFAPESLAVARQKLNAADAFITENPYDTKKMAEMAGDALFNAQRALQITRQSKRVRSMNSEQIASWVEGILHKTAKQLNTPDMRNEPFEVQVENILGSINALQEDRTFMVAKVKDLQAEKESLNKQIATLEAKTREEETAKERLAGERRIAEERLAAERQFNQKYTEIQQYFEPDEAEVYKQGNQLIIRLRGIQFPVGKEIIMPANYPLLSKVQRAIRTFDKPSVIIEGHTDSTGSDEVNQHLSQKRAESVREYLTANRTLPAEDIVAVGYGSMRPLASNETPEGRAINRRIDVMVKPQVPAGQ